MASPPPPIRTSAYGDETENEGSPLLPGRRSGSGSSSAALLAGAERGGGDAASTSEAASTGGEDVGGYNRGSGLDRLTMTTTATERESGIGGHGGRDASVMRALWASSGYHSDSALPSSSATQQARRSGVIGSREMLDPAAEPLMGTDGEREEESDGEHLRGYPHSRHHLEIGAASYDEERGAAAMAMHLGGHMGGMPVRAPSHQALLDSFNEQFRSPMSDDWAGTQPRKARWNRKVTRKRAKRPSTAVRKGRLAVYCIASELQTEKLQRYLLQRKKERVPILGPNGAASAAAAAAASRPPPATTGGTAAGASSPPPPGSGAPAYYGTNGQTPYPPGGSTGLQPAPPSLSTTNTSSLLLPTATVVHTASGSNHPLPPLTTSASAPPGGAASSSIYQSSSAAAAGAAGAKISAVETSDLVGLNWRDKNYMGVVYTTNDDGTCDPLEVKHIFCFPYGCTVFWGCTKDEEERFIAMISQFAVEPVSDLEREESYDDFVYMYGASPVILHYEVTLTSNDPEEKLALSFSLAQSAKLFVFEDRVDGTITSTKHIPLHLAEHGKINVSRKEISKLTGKVFLERNEVNLHSDILDTPEWFWEADLWEPRYGAFCKYLDLPNRINILNKRLDILRELLNVLETQLDNSHSTKLELIVIALIIVEVVLQVLEIALNDLFHVGSGGTFV